MDLSFQQIVIIVAVILLIITSSVIGYMMYSVDKLKPWPPSSNQCPDGWTYNASSSGCGSTGINVGSMIADISCSLTGSTGDNRYCGNLGFPWTDLTICQSGWVQGNAANFRDPSSCYMLANVTTTNIPTKYNGSSSYTYTPQFTYKPSSTMQDNIDWAKAFDISWDGLV